MSKDHLAKAKEYIAKGDGCYAKAADELIAAKVGQPDGPSYRDAAEVVGKSRKWCQDIVAWRTSGADTSTPWADDTLARQQRNAKQVLREAPPEQIAKLLDEPRIRANVSKAQTIAYEQIEERSRAKFRESVGSDVADELAGQQLLAEAEAEMFKARRALIEMLRHLNNADLASARDSWREEFLKTLDDLEAKINCGRALFDGTITDDALEAFLKGV